jgi:hypothetical protein
MYDLVLGDSLPPARGIKENINAKQIRLKIAKDKEELIKFAKIRNAIIYYDKYEFSEKFFFELKRKKGAVLFALKDIIEKSGYQRAITLAKIKNSFEECRKNNCNFLFCSLAEKKEELRNARELIAFMRIVGLSSYQIEFVKSFLKEMKK